MAVRRFLCPPVIRIFCLTSVKYEYTCAFLFEIVVYEPHTSNLESGWARRCCVQRYLQQWTSPPAVSHATNLEPWPSSRRARPTESHHSARVVRNRIPGQRRPQPGFYRSSVKHPSGAIGFEEPCRWMGSPIASLLCIFLQHQNARSWWTWRLNTPTRMRDSFYILGVMNQFAINPSMG